MKTLHIDFNFWIGSTVYYIQDSQVVESKVRKINYEMSISDKATDYIKKEYFLDNGCSFKDVDIDVIYFADKKKLIQKLVSELCD